MAKKKTTAEDVLALLEGLSDGELKRFRDVYTDRCSVGTYFHVGILVAASDFLELGTSSVKGEVAAFRRKKAGRRPSSVKDKIIEAHKNGSSYGELYQDYESELSPEGIRSIIRRYKKDRGG